MVGDLVNMMEFKTVSDFDPPCNRVWKAFGHSFLFEERHTWIRARSSTLVKQPVDREQNQRLKEPTGTSSDCVKV